MLAVLAIIGGSRMAVALVNWVATLCTHPVLLPRLDFSKGIPDTARTLVTIPTLLGNTAAIDNLCENIEVHYLANRGGNIYFSLLTDFRTQPRKVCQPTALCLITPSQG